MELAALVTDFLMESKMDMGLLLSVGKNDRQHALCRLCLSWTGEFIGVCHSVIRDERLERLGQWWWANPTDTEPLRHVRTGDGARLIWRKSAHGGTEAGARRTWPVPPVPAARSMPAQADRRIAVGGTRKRSLVLLHSVALSSPTAGYS
jgi:hypothetical protein